MGGGWREGGRAQKFFLEACREKRPALLAFWLLCSQSNHHVRRGVGVAEVTAQGVLSQRAGYSRRLYDWLRRGATEAMGFTLCFSNTQTSFSDGQRYLWRACSDLSAVTLQTNATKTTSMLQNEVNYINVTTYSVCTSNTLAVAKNTTV